ncbi:TPA: hypothetical protein R4193_002824 [Serratia marcescens]|uniref:hypothetical protein n=1 Tax=Serratia marcescens TaxID=615 RepID=UPI001C40CD7D|nr:hypothetical protein [Serratia marcescens]EGT0502868.1 hypothetical protein [Serratia marcescens]MDP8630509.1 hypothetical protein [Serratia marcescens]MDP8749341.1 hypothetical protein [Serratia marcescens]MDP8763648.1 hypothetical protein [Serratia marcescens]HBH7056202.1 hypothetical protein [Serratia marcescens]
MLDILQDGNGAIFKDGDLVLDGGITGIAQQCEIRVGMNRGEWWLDESMGLPWVFGIMGEKLEPEIVGKMISSEGVKTEGVTDIKINRIVFTGGKLSIPFDVYVGQQSQGVTINEAG